MAIGLDPQPFQRLCSRPQSLLFLLVLSFTQLPGQPTTGGLSGTITDQATAQPLVSANIVIVGLGIGAITDRHGHFTLRSIPVGSYTVRVEMIGYRPQSRAGVHVVPQRETAFNMALQTQALQGEEVVVTGRFFERARDAVVSAHTVDIEEIRSDPAGSYDIQKMMEALPAVALSSDQRNELIVRGGGLGENLFVMDHLEIPNPNHFGEPGSAGGAINIINTDFIERIDFYAGAFPARYGERLSSVMDITLREGDRQRFQTQLELSMAGIGAVMEGPVLDGRGSFLGSYRKSFLDLVIRNVGLTAVPHYANWQGKVVIDLGPATKLLLNVLGGVDGIDLEGSTVPLTRGIDNVLAEGSQLTYGATLQTLLSANGFGHLSLSRTQTALKYDLFNYLPDGRRQEMIDLNDGATVVMLNGDLNYRITPALDMALGFNRKWRAFDRNSTLAADTLWMYRYGIPGVMEPRYVSVDDYYDLILDHPAPVIVRDTNWVTVVPGWVSDSLYTTTSLGLFGQLKWRPAMRWELILGLRHYRVAANQSSDWAPRLGLTYAFTDRTAVNLALGRHFQAPAYFQLFNIQSAPQRNMSTIQVVLGLEHLFAEDTRGTLEIYRKLYENLVLEVAETTDDTSDTGGGFVNAGEGYAQGIELFLQKKFTRRWYGSCSYSRYRSLARDPRAGYNRVLYPRDSDYRHLLTIIGGAKLVFTDQAVYNRIREKPWWPWLAWLPVAPADEMELSFRLRLVGGRPYTPKVYNPTFRRWYQPARIELNNQRLDPYLRFDVMILRRFYFRKWNLVTFIDIQNVFDRDNPWDMVYYLDGSKEIALQYKQFPVGGITLEF